MGSERYSCFVFDHSIRGLVMILTIVPVMAEFIDKHSTLSFFPNVVILTFA